MSGKKLMLTLIALLGLHGVTMADLLVSEPELADHKLVGEAKLEYFFWDIYRARLYAPNGQYAPDENFALAITYLRDFKGEDIAERSLDEIRQQGFDDKQRLMEWDEKMKAIFPDVQEGQSITGVASNGVSQFYLDSNPIGAVDDAEFTRRFFAIWLGEKTSEPGMRRKLLNL
ncbi:chalcone isomerase family protein [Alteromonas flava]|uniref:chalcone isomerase family protein n=1 Tax=Alteromonas flava TaxID=2048003 RepID=UPI000C284E84|nr:chalcone isomerase family protein [Alteromonas flava]